MSGAEETDELPEGWAALTFEDAIYHALGGDWGKAAEDAPADWVPVGVIRGTEFRNWAEERAGTAALRYIKPSSLKSRELQIGDLVIEISGGGPDQPVGRSLVIDQMALESNTNPLICSNFCRRVRLQPLLDPGYVQWHLRLLHMQGDLNQFQNQTTNIRNLQFPDFIAGTTLKLPPLAEQRRIVAAIETRLARVEAVKQRLQRVPAILKRFRQSVLAAACSGELTAGWREGKPQEPVATALEESRKHVDAKKIKHLVRRGTVGMPETERPDFPDHWELRTVRELVEAGAIYDFQDGNHGSLYPRASDFGEAGVKFLTAQQVFDNQVLLDETPLLGYETAKLLRIGFAKPRDVLLTHNATVGRVAVLPEFDGDVILGTSVTYYRTNHEVLMPEYVAFQMQGQYWQDQLKSVMEQTTRNQVSVTKQVEFRLTVPPLAEQQEIVRRVERLLQLAEQVQQRVQLARKRVEKLTQAILAQAFRGELVPTEAELARREGRDYEPAAALLERIRRERSQMPTASRKSPRRKAAEE